MGASPRPDLILFVAGEPDSGVGSTKDVQTLGRRLTGSVVGGWWQGRSASVPPSPAYFGPSSAEAHPWHLPPQHTQCVKMVFEIAGREGRRVELVDVNRPAGQQELIDRWFRADEVLPLLVRLDGGRLQGIESFVPKRIRRFIGGRGR